MLKITPDAICLQYFLVSYVHGRFLLTWYQDRCVINFAVGPNLRDRFLHVVYAHVPPLSNACIFASLLLQCSDLLFDFGYFLEWCLIVMLFTKWPIIIGIAILLAEKETLLVVDE